MMLARGGREPRCGSQVPRRNGKVLTMATRTSEGLTDRARARGIRVAGIAIIVLAAGAALLPVEKGISSDILGALLIAAGFLEIVAGSLRRQVRILAMAVGVVTVLAGLLFTINPETRFFPTVMPIAGWLSCDASCSVTPARTLADPCGGGWPIPPRWTCSSRSS